MKTVPEMFAALDAYRPRMADGIREMAGERGLNPAALSPENCVKLITEEAEWSEQFARSKVTDQAEKDGELRHAAAMREIAARMSA